MKLLYLIRHAKSPHDNVLLPDIERPLNKRGEQDAKRMAEVLKEKSSCPGLFISSPAKRALSTATLFAEELNYNKDKIQVAPVLYSFDAEKIISFIEETENEINSLALFTHNPTVTEVANLFSRENIFSMPTCAVAAIRFETDKWSDIGFQKGKLLFLEYPKLHRHE